MRAVNIEGQHYGASDKPDAVVAYPATAESANRQFPARRLLLVGAAVDLPSMLCHGDFGTVTFVGGWRDLTVTVSRALTEWAAVDERRGCGVVLAEDESSPTSRLEAGRPKPVMGVHDQIALLVSGLPGGILTGAGFERIAEPQLITKVFARVPPVAVSLTGHGAEYCVRVGNSWLTTDPRLPPPGVVLSPSRLRSPAVFLNCCGSLRMGDSIVPKRYSLARNLYRRGIAVIGPFRNVHTSPDAGLLFAEALRRGWPMGRVANYLNMNAARWHETSPAFQLLGDPTTRVVSGQVRFPQLPLRQPEVDIDDLIQSALDLDLLYATLAGWRRPAETLHVAHEGLLDVIRLLVLARKAEEISFVERPDRMTLEAVAGAATTTLRQALLVDVSEYVTRNWFDALYSPLSRRTTLAEFECARCGQRVTRYRYEPAGQRCLPVERDECDRCGTLGERVGRSNNLPLLGVTLAGGELLARVKPLTPDAIGLVFVRKYPDIKPRPIASRVGSVSFPLATLKLRGRVTVAAVAIEQSGLSVGYETIFLPL